MLPSSSSPGSWSPARSSSPPWSGSSPVYTPPSGLPAWTHWPRSGTSDGCLPPTPFCLGVKSYVSQGQVCRQVPLGHPPHAYYPVPDATSNRFGPQLFLFSKETAANYQELGAWVLSEHTRQDFQGPKVGEFSEARVEQD